MAHIFISYSKHDPDPPRRLRLICRRAATLLVEYKPFIGDDFPDLIKRKIDEPKAVISI